MDEKVPKYIEARIRASCPDDCSVVPGSTPVVAFGDVRRARVATLGLNPSRAEFLDRSGRELDGEERRLETHRSIGYSDLSSAPHAVINQVFEGCNGYFQRRPYTPWFNKFNPILDAVNGSYSNGTACHLDLIQWATNPTWRRLKPKSLREKLLAADAPFLLKQLELENVRLLLLNGRAVIKRFELIAPEVGLSVVTTDLKKTTVFAGSLSKRLKVIGWSVNLQSSFGVSTRFIGELASIVQQLAGKTR
jgi:hypothetical protein